MYKSTFLVRNRTTRFIIVIIIILLAFTIIPIVALDWNGADTTGTFDVPNDLTLSDQITVSNDLRLTGRGANDLTVITAASNKRHFYVDYNKKLYLNTKK